MKTNISILAIAVLLLAVACNKNKCNNGASTDLVSLSKEDFNTCTAVLEKYTDYPASTREEYPYWDEEGNTIKVCGWIKHDYGNTIHASSGNVSCIRMCDDSVVALDSTSKGGAGVDFEMDSSLDLLNGVNREEKCYIMGTLTFNPKITCVYTPEPSNHCLLIQFAINPIKISNYEFEK